MRDALVGDARRPRVGRRPAFRDVLDGLLGGVALRRFAAGARHRRSRRCPAASGGGSRSPGCCSTRPSCCCSTSRPTTSTSRASTGWRATSPRGAARCSSSPTTAGSWTRSAPRPWEVADGERPPVRGRLRGLRAGPRRARPPGGRARGPPPQLMRKELAWLRRGPPARTVQAEVPHRGRQRADRRRARGRATAPSCCASRPRGWATRCSTPSTCRVAYGDRRVLRDVTWRLGPGDRLGAGRRQRLGQDVAASRLLARRARADGGHGRARRDRPPRPPLPGHGRDPRAPAGARVAGGGPRRAPTLGDGQRDHRGHAVRALRLPRRARPHAGARPLRRRAPAAAADAPADGRAQRAAARRAHQRPRHRHAHRARGPARRLARARWWSSATTATSSSASATTSTR